MSHISYLVMIQKRIKTWWWAWWHRWLNFKVTRPNLTLLGLSKSVQVVAFKPGCGYSLDKSAGWDLPTKTLLALQCLGTLTRSQWQQQRSSNPHGCCGDHQQPQQNTLNGDSTSQVQFATGSKNGVFQLGMVWPQICFSCLNGFYMFWTKVMFCRRENT